MPSRPVSSGAMSRVEDMEDSRIARAEGSPLDVAETCPGGGVACSGSSLRLWAA